MMNQLLQDIRQFIPSDRIYTDELRTLGWGTDASFYRQIPKVVIRSDGEEEISKIVKACEKYKLPFTFRAAGTSLSGQSCTESVLIVAGKHWEKYEIGENQETIKLQPGIVGGKVNEILKPYGRVFPPDPASIGSAMVGGIVINNASGMNCGVHANSDRMMISARIILTDGTVLDTGSEDSKDAFRKSHPEFLKKIEALRDKVRADEALTSRIRTKYSIKNVTGLNLRPLVAYDDPFDIIAHSMVGSEGTLAFLSEVTMKTLIDYKFKASAMVYFLTMKESCEAVVAMKKMKAGEDDLTYSAENLVVKSAEMLDYMSLASVDDPVYLQYKKDVDAGKIPGVAPGDYKGLTAISFHNFFEQRITEGLPPSDETMAKLALTAGWMVDTYLTVENHLPLFYAHTLQNTIEKHPALEKFYRDQYAGLKKTLDIVSDTRYLGPSFSDEDLNRIAKSFGDIHI